MKKVAIVSFPGNNCEVESIRSISRSGMEPIAVRWNQDPESLKDIDAYFLVGGFNYEDRGRAGMVAARHPMLDFIRMEACKGKVVLGNCNGAQLLVESGLVPFNTGLCMSLARNVCMKGAHMESPGFINEWIYMKPTCAKNKCATSNWSGTMHIPIAHGEGRFVTKDREVIEEMKRNDQIAFSYCDANGTISTDIEVTPNGSMYSIAGICNPQGNVVAIMPHPERTILGDPYFHSLRNWLETVVLQPYDVDTLACQSAAYIPVRNKPDETQVFIDSIITNNEERTVEYALKRHLQTAQLRQMKFFSITSNSPASLLGKISIFNPNKEIAYIRRNGKVTRWNDQTKSELPIDLDPFVGAQTLLRRDEPDTTANSLSDVLESGTCYICTSIDSVDKLRDPQILEIFANPHASTLESL